MLILDEKKIRKGRPLGLPYQGSKKKISKKIIEIIKQNFGTDKMIYDVFGGGGAIFYLDPPYENTTHIGYKGCFDSIDFYDWAFEMSKKNKVLISSYEISDDRFKCVYEFKTARSTLQGGIGGKCEKLFMVK